MYLLKVELKADLVDGDVSADVHEDVHERLVLVGVINGGAEGLDEPGPGLGRAEAVVVPEGGLELAAVLNDR